MKLSPLFDELIRAFQCLPGVGPKSAQRMALHALERDRVGAQHLGDVLQNALVHIGRCRRCRVHTEMDVCELCCDTSRDVGLVCVVETVTDMIAIEQTQTYNGRYFVLQGHLSPLDGVGPEDIGLPELLEQMLDPQSPVREVILAMGTTVEGEATAHVIMQQLAQLNAQGHTIKMSRIAYGVPMGGGLELVDKHTIGHALVGRQALNMEYE